MKRIFFILVTCLFLINFSTAFAAQNSLNTGRDEFKTLLSDRQLNKLDSGDTIKAIYRTHTGFTILTDKHKLKVDVVQDKTGKGEFHLVFHDPVARTGSHKLKEKASKEISTQKSDTAPAAKSRSHKAVKTTAPSDEE